MTSTKSAKAQRTNLPRTSNRSKAFAKDWERLSHSGRYDMHRLKTVMLLLIGNETPLPAEYLDHALAGDWDDYRECHVGGDFLLIYQLPDSQSVLFARAGTHSELFGR